MSKNLTSSKNEEKATKPSPEQPTLPPTNEEANVAPIPQSPYPPVLENEQTPDPGQELPDEPGKDLPEEQGEQKPQQEEALLPKSVEVPEDFEPKLKPLEIPISTGRPMQTTEKEDLMKVLAGQKQNIYTLREKLFQKNEIIKMLEAEIEALKNKD